MLTHQQSCSVWFLHLADFSAVRSSGMADSLSLNIDDIMLTAVIVIKVYHQKIWCIGLQRKLASKSAIQQSFFQAWSIQQGKKNVFHWFSSRVSYAPTSFLCGHMLYLCSTYIPRGVKLILDSGGCLGLPSGLWVCLLHMSARLYLTSKTLFEERSVTPSLHSWRPFQVWCCITMLHTVNNLKITIWLWIVWS